MTLRPRRQQYSVKPGDNLWRIAQYEYGDGTVWQEIAKANAIPNGNVILTGMILKLPSTAKACRRNSWAGSPDPIQPQGIHSSPAGPIHPRDFAAAPKAQVLGPQRPGSVPIHHDAPEDRLSLMNMPPARGVTYPTLVYQLADARIGPVYSPFADYLVTLTGELAVQRIGLMDDVEISMPEDVTRKLKDDYDARVIQITDAIKVRPSTDWRSVDVSSGFTVATTLSGAAFVNQPLKPATAGKYRCSIQPADIAGEDGGLRFAGNLGFEIEIRGKDLKSSNAPIASWVTIGPISALGSAEVGSDLIRDAERRGVSMSTGPLAWAGAMALYAQSTAVAP